MNIELERANLALERAGMELFFAMRRAALGLPQATPPTDTWEALVERNVAAGLTRVAAIQAAARERPDLYRAQATPKEQTVVSAARPIDARWEAAITERTRRGLIRSAAILDIAKTNRALWESYSAG